MVIRKNCYTAGGPQDPLCYSWSYVTTQLRSTELQSMSCHAQVHLLADEIAAMHAVMPNAHLDG